MEKINELNNERKLATITKILDIQPIPDADNIEKIFVRGWQCIARKGEYKVGDLCIYIEIDSILPDGLSIEKQEEWRALNKQMSKAESEEQRDLLRAQMAEISKLNIRPEFEFLRAVKFHVKTRKILGEISQGICFPLSIFNNTEIWAEDDNVTDILGVTQYIAPDPATMGGNAAGMLTGVGLLITDEERIENLSSKYEALKQFTYYKTEKLDGTSCTVYLKAGRFGVCGRTIDFQVPDENDAWDAMNVYWKVAKKFKLETKMRKMAIEYDINDFALQGEIVGEGVQGNIYKLKGQQVCFYNAFDIGLQEYWNFEAFINLLKDTESGLHTVPILEDNYTLPETAKELLEEADKTTTVFGNNPNQLIEGFVYVARETIPATVRITRSSFGRLSFKAKSRTFDMLKGK